jgi:hypothetical protein
VPIRPHKATINHSINSLLDENEDYPKQGRQIIMGTREDAVSLFEANTVDLLREGISVGGEF